MADKPAKVLVVDDDPEWRDLAAMALSGYRVVKAEDGAEGYQTALKEHPDLILSDMSMPKMSGPELLRELRSNPDLFSIPVILITAQQLDPSTQSLAQQFPSVRGFLRKPCSVEDILGAARYVLGMAERAGVKPPAAAGRLRYNVLVVDDDPSVAQFVAIAMHPDDTLHRAQDGAEALQKLKATPMNLVVTDMMMPRLSGIELMRAMGQDAKLRGIQVILLTGTPFRPPHIGMMKKEFPNLWAVIEKPCEARVLREALEGVLVRDVA